MIKIFCRNKHLTGIKNKQLKQFYIRGVRLLISSCTIDEFREILIALLTTMMSETNGLDEANNVTPSEASKNKILNLIKGITLNDINGEKMEHNKENNTYTQSDDDGDGESEGITECLRAIEEESKINSKLIGTSLSGYWAPNLVKDVLRICKDFPLWTSVMKIYFSSIYDTPTSTSVESDFGDKTKNSSLRN